MSATGPPPRVYTPLLVKTPALLAATAIVIALAACSRTSPAAPSGPAAIDLNGVWTGSGTDAQGPMTFKWTLAQNGGAISGQATMDPADPNDGSCGSCHKQKAGTVAGTIAGGALTLTLDFPEGGAYLTPLCGLKLMATSTDFAARRIAATYTGTTTCEGPIANGTLNMAR